MFLTRRNFLKSGSLGLGAAALASCKASGGIRNPETSPKAFDQLQPMTAGIEAPNESDFQQRREQLRRELRQSGAKALLFAGNVSLRYFTGIHWGISDRFWGAVLFETGEPIFITPAFEKARALETTPRNAEIRIWEEDEDPLRLVGDCLRERGIGSGPLAIEVEIPFRYVEQLTKANPGIEITSGFEPVRNCRMIKSVKEISILRRANEITQRAIRAVAQEAEEGISQETLTSWINEAQRKLGLSNPWSICLFGPNAAYPHGTKEKRALREGDLILCDTGGTLLGYQSDITRTWVFGKASSRQQKVWDSVFRAQTAALEAARPGNPCDAVDKAARKELESSGFAGTRYKFLHHRLGHGIGMEGHEEPYMVAGNSLLLRPGMTSSNEPGIYIYDELGVRLEDILLITETGSEILGSRAQSISQP